MNPPKPPEESLGAVTPITFGRPVTAGVVASFTAALGAVDLPQYTSVPLERPGVFITLTAASQDALKGEWEAPIGDAMPQPAPSLTREDIASAMKEALASRAGPFAWKEWAGPVAMAAIVGLGVLDFSGRLGKIEDRLTGLEKQVGDDYKALSDKIGALAIQVAHDEGSKRGS